MYLDIRSADERAFNFCTEISDKDTLLEGKILDLDAKIHVYN